MQTATRNSQLHNGVISIHFRMNGGVRGDNHSSPNIVIKSMLQPVMDQRIGLIVVDADSGEAQALSRLTRSLLEAQ